MIPYRVFVWLNKNFNVQGITLPGTKAHIRDVRPPDDGCSPRDGDFLRQMSPLSEAAVDTTLKFFFTAVLQSKSICLILCRQDK